MRTVKQVAKAAGISVRALHHYDHIGLLKPVVGRNGYRYYDETTLLRLQRILFYRELGVPLAEVARLLDDPALDARAALVDLKARVDADIERRLDLSRTIEHTLRQLDAGRPIAERSLFEGITPQRQAEWEAELVALYGPATRTVIDDANARLAALPDAGMLDLKASLEAIHAEAMVLIERGCAPSSQDAMALIARHHAWVCRSWQPDAEAYAGLARLYVEHGDFRKTYDALHPELADFLAAAMAHYAAHVLHGEA